MYTALGVYLGPQHPAEHYYLHLNGLGFRVQFFLGLCMVQHGTLRLAGKELQAAMVVS